MKSFKITIKSKSPYMQHRMDDVKLEAWEKSRGKIIERAEVSQENAVRAEYHCFRDAKTNQCYIPSEHIRQSLINAGSFMKSKVGNARKSMKNIVAAMFMVDQEKIFIPDYDEVDVRTAVNKNVKARVCVVRPKWSSLNISFDLIIDDDTITKETIKELLDYSGRYIGIGSYRPQNNGSFGRFEVVSVK